VTDPAPPASRRRPGRVRRKSEFDRTMREGGLARDDLMKVFVCRNGLADTRLGVSVSRKHGDAVRRNRVRRRLRHAFAAALARLPDGVDVIVVPFPLAVEPDFTRVVESMVKLTLRALDRLRERASQQAAPGEPPPDPPHA